MSSLPPTKNFRTILREELESRCERNSRYSLRAFARDLGISPSRISEVLNGRYGLSRQAAEAIAAKLGWSGAEAEHFGDLVEMEHARARKKRLEAKSRVESREPYQPLSMDAFQVISDWYYYGILELTTVQGFQSDAQWIARKLGISQHMVIAAIERLKRLELLVEKDGVFRATSVVTASPSGVPSDAVKKMNRQLLDKAMTSIHLQNLQERDISHMVLAIDSAKMEEAKEEIKRFRRSFDARFGAAPQKDSVYCLGVTFFRLQDSHS